MNAEFNIDRLIKNVGDNIKIFGEFWDFQVGVDIRIKKLNVLLQKAILFVCEEGTNNDENNT